MSFSNEIRNQLRIVLNKKFALMIKNKFNITFKSNKLIAVVAAIGYCFFSYCQIQKVKNARIYVYAITLDNGVSEYFKTLKN